MRKRATSLRVIMKSFALALAVVLCALQAGAQVSVTATGAGPGPVAYTTLQAAFNAVNAGTHTGAITITISSSTTEPGSCVLNSTGAGSASYTSVSIRPSADAVSVSGPSLQGRGLIELNGADNVTIDGDNPGSGGTNRNLSFVNTAANTVTFTSVIRLATSATVANADNNIIRNCVITGSSDNGNLAANTSTTAAYSTSFGIYCGGNADATATNVPLALTSVTANTSASGQTMNAFNASNNAVSNCAYGIAFMGANANVSTGITIANNIVGGAGTLTTYPYTTPAQTVYLKGIYVQGTTAVSITGNTVRNILSYVGILKAGIELNTAIGAGTIDVSSNTISGVVNNVLNNFSARGISIVNAGGPYTVNNNTISNIENWNGSTTNTTRPIGIYINTAAASATINGNKVSSVYNRHTNTLGVVGVWLNGGSNITFSNNFVWDINQDITGGSAHTNLTWGIFGIIIDAGTGHKVHYNTLYMTGATMGTPAASILISGLTISNTSQTGMDVRNNILVNNMTGPTTGSIIPFYLPTGATSAMNLTLNNNAYISGTTSMSGIAKLGTAIGASLYLAADFNAGATTPAANLRAYTSPLSAAGTNDNTSQASTTVPAFVSTTDLHLQSVPANAGLQVGVPIAGITADIDGTLRSGGTTIIGAHEVSFVTGPVTITATAGVTATTAYPTLLAAFNAINAGTHMGAVTVNINQNLTEAGSCVLNSTGAGSASYTSVLIRPTVDGLTVSGPSLQGRGLIELNGADNVTIDGDNPATSGTNRNLSFVNTAANTVTFTSVIRLATSATVATADNNIIRNCIITGSSDNGNLAANTSTAGAYATSFGIYCGGNADATATNVPLALTSVTANTSASGQTMNTFNATNNAVSNCAYGIAFMGANANVSTGITIANNIVGGAGTLTTYPYTTPAQTVYLKGIYVQGTTAVSITGNTVRNILSYVGILKAGIELNTAIGAGTIDVSSNTISGVVNNVLNNFSARGISIVNAGGPYTVNNNTISNIENWNGSTTNTTRPMGIYINTAAASATINGNKVSSVYNRHTNTLGVVGVWLNGGSNITFSNNFVRDINQDITGGSAHTNLTWGIFGIIIDAGTGHKVYYNTLYMTGATLGTPAASILISGLTISNTSQTGMDIRNNILINNMTGPTTGSIIPFYLPTGATSAMNLTLNNNVYISGSSSMSGIAKLGTAIGTSLYLAADFNAGATTPAANLRSYTAPLSAAGTNDNASKAGTTVPTFVSASDLHLQVVGANAYLISGAPVSVTTDIDGTTRAVTTTTIGAHEIFIPHSITYTALPSSTCNTGTLALTATIADAVAVNNTTNPPMLYYRVNAGAWSSGITGTLASGTTTNGTWNFIIPGNAAGSTVDYFVIAQSSSGGAYSQPSAGLVAASTTSISTYPTSPSTYTISAGFNGTYHVGTGSAQPYATVTAAVTAYNAACLNGPVTFLLDNATYPSETFPISISNSSASAFNTLTIRPNTGASPVISGSSASGIFVLNGADYVTIDGSNNPVTNTICPRVAASRNMTITNTNTSTTSAVVWMQTSGSDGATNNTIRNCNITGSGTTQTLAGIGSGSTTIGYATLGTGNNNNRIENNSISAVQCGVLSRGASAANKNTGTVINQNLMNTASPNNIRQHGIFASFEDNITVSGNEIANLNGASADLIGINLGFGSTAIGNTATTGSDVTNATVNYNKVDNIIQTGSWSVVGIAVAGVTTGTTTISNNMISGMSARGTGTDLTAGIFVGGAAGGVTNIYYNTINNTGVQATGTQPTYALAISGTDPIVNIRNNILINSGDAGAGMGLIHAIGVATSTYTNLTSNNNDFFSIGTNLARVGSLGTGGTTLATLALWQSTTGRDANSLNMNPVFVSASDLHLQTTAANVPLVSGTPVTSPSITTDFDCGSRSGSTPVLGAHEVNISNYMTYTALINTCNTGNIALNSVNIVSNVGVNNTTFVPRVYFRKNAGGWFSTAGTLASGTINNGMWNFTITPASMGGVVSGDVIQYYIIAQTTGGTVFSNPSAGLVATNTTSVTTPPTTPNSYTIFNTLGGIYYVGAGEDYNTITDAVNAYNNSCITASVTFILTDNTYPSETYPITINSNPYTGPGNTLTIKPDVGKTPLISGSNATAIFKLNGADYVRFDGSNTVGGTTRNMTITNTNVSNTAAVIWLAGVTASNGATNNIIRNCNISGSGATGTGFGIEISGATIAANAAIGNDDNFITNNSFTNLLNGVDVWGYGTAPYDADLIVTRNAISALGSHGIRIQNVSNFEVSENTISNISSAQTTNALCPAGIQVLQNSSVGEIWGNNISNISNTGSIFGAGGINLGSSSTNAGITVYNNFVNDVFAPLGWTSTGGYRMYDNGIGIAIDLGGGYNIYYNTVIQRTNQGQGAYTAALAVDDDITGTLDIRNNIFINAQTGGATNRVAFLTNEAASQFASFDYNNYVGNTALGFTGSTARANIAAMQAFTGNLNSKNVSPVFVNPASDLHLTTAAVNGGLQFGTAISTPPITSDIDGNSRATISVVGAHEIHIGPAITYTALNAATCGTGDIALNGVSISDALGVPTAGGNMPRVYYRKGAGAWQSAAGTLASGTGTSGTWNFTMSASAMGGLVNGDVVSYYVIAQNTPPGNVSSNPSAGLVATSVNAVTTAPTTPNTTTINVPALNSLTAAQAVCFSASSAQTANFSYSGITGGANQYTLSWTPSGSLANVVSMTALPGSPIGINVPANTGVNTYTGVMTIQNSSTTCTNTHTISVTVNALPVVTFTAQPGSATCYNTNVTYTTQNGMSNYVWTFTGSAGTDYTIVSGGTSTDNTVTLKWLTAGSRTANVNYTNANSCTAVSATSSTTTVYMPPVAITGNAQMCAAGSTITLANASGGGTWSSATTLVAAVDANTGVVTPGVQGTAVVTYDNGCGTAQITTTVNAAPVATTGNAQMCEAGSGITLANTSTNGTWSSDNASVATVNMMTGAVTPGVQGTAMITYDNGCGTAVITATVNAAPVAIGGNGQLCSGGSTLTLTNASTNGTWSGGTTSVATINSMTGLVTSNAQGTTTFMYSNGCGSATSVTTTVNNTPAAITGNVPTCTYGLTATLANASTNGTWSSSNPAMASVNAMTGVVTTGSVSGFPVITYDNGCGTAAQATFTVLSGPIIQTFTGGGGYCVGGTGVSIGLTLSETGVNYQLFQSGTPVSAIMPGTTGSPITFGTTYLTPGYYYAMATYTGTGCVSNMPGVTVHVNPLPDVFNVTGGGSYCSSGGAGVAVGMENSVVGINYELYNASSVLVATEAGTGAAISFGLQPAGLYTAKAVNATTGCEIAMAGSATVDFYPSPTQHNVLGGGTYCLGGSGVNISLDNSDLGIDYQLIYLGVIPIGGAIDGIAGALDMGLHFLPGDYTIVGRDTTTGCTDTMSGVATLEFALPPTPFFVGGGGGYCAGDPGVNITLSGSQLGVRYQVYDNAGAPVGAAVDGTSAALDFGLFTTVGTYTVQATDTTTGCTSNMLFSATVTMNPVVIPTVSLNTGVGPDNRVCFGNPITFSAVTTNGGTTPTYEWKINNITVPGTDIYTYVPTDGDIVWVRMTSSTACAIPAQAMDTMFVDVDTVAVPSVFVTVDPITSVPNGTTVTFTAHVTNGGPAPTFRWFKNGGLISGATASVYSTSNLANKDSIMVEVTTSGGCGGVVTYNGVRVTVYGVGVPTTNVKISDVRLIPNPNKGLFSLQGSLSTAEDTEVDIDVVNMLGQSVFKGKVKAKKGEINEQIQLTNNLANGMYMLNMIAGEDRKVFHFVLEQ